MKCKKYDCCNYGVYCDVCNEDDHYYPEEEWVNNLKEALKDEV